MKRILLTLLVALTTAGAAMAQNASDLRVYINPGHGGWGPNDRPMATIPYPMLSSGRPDTCGFYESNTNLWKGLEMRRALTRMGLKASNITMSRTESGPYPYDGNTYGAYSKQLSVISAEAESGDYDMFISIHSNALTEGTTTNYPLYLYRGTDASDYASGSKAMCQASWPRHFMNEVDPTSGSYSKTTTYIKGDITFYGSSSTSTNSSSGVSYTGYLGALKHGVPGFLVEGYFHTYQPARHRALNRDYCCQEGIRLARGAADYFGISGENTGYIMGAVKDAVNSLENSLYTYKAGSIDAKAPINGAVVRLYKGGTLVASYTTDNNYNGIFVFNNLTPGNDYTISIEAEGFETLTAQGPYTVRANETTYPVLYMNGGSAPVTTTVKGIYAYDLNRNDDGNGNYQFTFKCNSDANEAYLVFTDATTGTEVGRVTLNDIVEGSNTVTLTNDQLPGNGGQEMKWAVNVVGDPITSIKRLNENYKTYTRASVAIDRSPESNHFGAIYVGERVAKNSVSNGLYACDINGRPLNSTVYSGGQTWANDMRIGIDGEGKIYMTEWGDATSGIYIANPDNLGGTYTQFFVGTRASSGLITNNGANVGGSTPSIWIQGTGADTKLYAYQEDIIGATSNKGNNVAVYNIGQSDGSLLTTWDTAPSQLFDVGALELNGNGNLIADAGGRGVWVMQYRSAGQNLASVPSLIFVDNAGTVRYNSGSSLSTLSGSLMSGFAINNSNDVMVINDGDGVLQFFNITWNGTTPTLTHNGTSYTADARGSNNAIYQMAFDWGGNLVCAGGNIGIYSIPTDNNQSTTPAKASLTVTKNESYTPGDVNADGSVSPADLSALIDYLLSGDSHAVSVEAADVNQDNSVSPADLSALIDLLLS